MLLGVLYKVNIMSKLPIKTNYTIISADSLETTEKGILCPALF